MTLDRVGITVVLNKLARQPGRARELYNKIMGSWGQRPDRQRVTLKLGERDLQVLESLNLRRGILGRDVLPSGYLAVYQHPKNAQLEVVIHSKEKPPKRRTLKVGGKKSQLVRVSVRRIKDGSTNHKEASVPATKRKKKVEEDEIDELEGLEDLEDLEDEEIEEDEPEDEEEDEEDEEPAPKKRGRAKAAPAKKTPAKKSTRKKAPEPEAEEEDEEDEEEEETPPRRTKKGAAKAAPAKGKAKTAKSKAATSKSKDKEAPKAKKGGNGNLPTVRELPKGQVGPADIAEMVGGECDARYVRIYLRENYERPEGGRWAFGKQEARGIAKEIKAHRRKSD